MTLPDNYQSDNKDTMAIIDKIDRLGTNIDEKIGNVHERINKHLGDCRNRHNGVDLKKIDSDVDNLKAWTLKVTGALTFVFALITFLKDAIIAYIK